MNTRIVWCGDEFVVPGKWKDVTPHLGSDEKSYIKMMKRDGEWEKVPTTDTPTTTVPEFVLMVEVATTSTQMDG